MATIGLSRARDELARLGRKLWDFDEIEVRINSDGVTIYPYSRPENRVQFKNNPDRLTDAITDAFDYFRAGILLRYVDIPGLDELGKAEEDAV